jgi:hypothetical protein
MRQAACVAGAWLASGTLPAVAAGAAQRHPRSLLVDSHGKPWSARQLKAGEAILFNYPYTASPVFLIAFGHEVKPAELVTEDKSTTGRRAASGRTGRSSRSRRSARTSWSTRRARSASSACAAAAAASRRT